MFVTKKAISRRTVLRGVGTALALPLLDAMVPAFAPAASTKPIRRFGVVYHPNGIIYDEDDSLPGTSELLRSFGLRVKQAINQLVLITTNGSAQPVAVAVDAEGWDEVVGTVAGDDTLLVVGASNKSARNLQVRLEAMRA